MKGAGIGTEMATNILHMHLYGNHVERFLKNRDCLPKPKDHKENENMRKTGNKRAALH